MNRKEALEAYKKETEEVCREGMQKLEDRYTEEEKWLEDTLYQAIEKLCRRVQKTVRYFQISLLRAGMDLETFQFMIAAYDEEYFLDTAPVSETVDAGRLFEPLKSTREQLYERAGGYGGKIQKFDADRMIRETAVSFYKKRAGKMRKFFRDFDRWDCIRQLPQDSRLIVKWGEHRELSDTLFLLDRSEKNQEQFVCLNEENTIEQWDGRYVYQCWDSMDFLDMNIEKKNLMFAGLRACHMENCQWDRTFFYGGSFREASLEQVIFVGCDLTGCDFRNVRLEQVRFIQCNLSEADFSGADMEDVEFPGSVMEGTRFSRENLSGRGLDAGQLQQVKLEEAPYVFYNGRR